MLKVTIKNETIKSIREPSAFIDCHFSPGYEIEIDENTKVTVMGGEYWIKEVEQLREGVRFTCYDSMCKLDEPFTLGTITGTPYQILTQATTACGVPLKSTQAEIEALPNGTRTFTLHSDNDCKTWRDVLSYLSMLMGCFVTFARYTYGVLALPGLVVRPFGNGKENPDDTVTDVHRYKGAKFSIFDTEYKAIELTAYAVDGENTVKKDFTYAETTGVTGQTIKLGYNPFIQADTPEADLTQTQRDILHELLTQVDKYAYTPMQISLPVGFIYDLGDVIKCTGGLANTGFAGGYTEDCYCCISNYTYTYGKEFRIKTLESKAAKARPIIIPTPPMPQSEYALDDAQALVVTLVTSGYWAYRIDYQKTNDGRAYVAYYTLEEDGHDRPLLVSKDKNAVAYTVVKESSGETGYYEAQGSFSLWGDTWYYAGQQSYYHRGQQKVDGVAQYIGTFVTTEEAAMYLLRLVYNKQLTFTARADSIVTQTGTLSTNNGSRTPVTKVNNGKAAGLISTNTFGDVFGGNWIGVTLLSLEKDAALVHEPTNNYNKDSIFVDGYRIYYGRASTNSSRGGGTTFTNPLGLPVTNDVIMTINQKLTESEMRNIMRILQFQVIEP
jgi:hypothetical protein